MITIALLLALNWTPRVVNRPMPFNRASIRDSSHTYIVIHSDESNSISATFRWLKKKRNSYHYYISKTGVVYKMVDPKYMANHAGRSEYDGLVGMNKYSVGIGLENKSPGDFPDAQYKSLAWLILEIEKRYRNSRFGPIVSHQDVAVPIGRKKDPGENFIWWRLADYMDLFRLERG